MGKSDLSGNLFELFLCGYLEWLSFELDAWYEIILELFLSSLSHCFLIVIEVLLTWVLVGHLSCLLVLPEFFALFVSALLVAGQLGLLELVLEQGLLVDLPPVLKSVDRRDHVRADWLAPLQSLALQRDCLGLKNAQVSMPVCALTLKLLFQRESAPSMHQMFANLAQVLSKEPPSNKALQSWYFDLVDVEALRYWLIIHHLISKSAPLCSKQFTKEALNLDRSNFTLEIFQNTLLVLTARLDVWEVTICRWFRDQGPFEHVWHRRLTFSSIWLGQLTLFFAPVSLDNDAR